MLRYKVHFRNWENPIQEFIDYDEPEEFVEFVEEEKIYEGEAPDNLTLAFVDGVRRTELACYLENEDGEIFEAMFASVGAGAVYLHMNRLNLMDEALLYPTVERVFLVRKGLDIENYIDLEDLKFSVRLCKDRDISQEINYIMKEELESSTAKKIHDEGRFHIIFCDGILGKKLAGTSCVGYVKNIKRLFLKDTRLIDNLKPGQRTPILRVRNKDPQGSHLDKYVWYLKLSPTEKLWSLVRLEVFAHIPEEKVVQIANISAGVLPLLASQPFIDTRSPQNLLPIRALENALRKHLGHYSMIRHKILEFLNV